MKKETEKVLRIIAEKARLAEGSEGIRSILLTMFRFPSLKNKKVSQKTGIAIPALAAARGELVKAGIIEKKNFLGKRGREWIKNNLGLQFEFDPPRELSEGEIPDNLESLSNIKSILDERPEPDFSLDQSHATSNTVIRRVLYLVHKGDIEGRKIIFLGDDDGTSLAVGLTDLAEKITVVDIDPNVLSYLKKKASELSLKNYDVFPYDLREPCPSSLLNKFDVVVMDPPYTNEGLRLFLKRATQVLCTCLKVDQKSYDIVGKKIMLCFGNKPPELMLQNQLSILGHGFTINEMIPYFNIYKGASIIGQFSHLYYLQSTTLSKSIENNLHLKLHPIYTSEVSYKTTLPFRPLGYHFIGEMRFNKEYVFEDGKIQELFYYALKEVNLTIIDVYQHYYKPHGYTTVAILETSHAALHTWPEHGYISIDIFICDEFNKGINVIKILKNRFQPQNSKFFYIERGTNAEEGYKPI